jgi:hypothetical protein
MNITTNKNLQCWQVLPSKSFASYKLVDKTDLITPLRLLAMEEQ